MSKYYEQHLSELICSFEDDEALLPEALRSLIKQTHKELRSIDIMSEKVFDLERKDLKIWTIKHFPVLKTKKSIDLEDFFDTICACDINHLALVPHKLIEDKNKGYNPLNIIKEINKGEDRLEKLLKPKPLTKADGKKYPKLTEAEWKTKCNELNREALLHYNYQVKLKKDFFAAMQTTLLKILPGIQNFNAEETMVFNEFLEDAFVVVYRYADRMQKIISYDIKLDYYYSTDEEVAAAISKCSKKKQAEVKENELRRWMGEKKVTK